MRSAVVAVIAVLVTLVWLTPAEAATSRGIEVTLKESETKDAAVSRTVRLYEESYALVIGIDNYTGGWPRLSNAVAAPP